tara:strand:+ start:822 stop:1250 length:429 start_codon:yes stop_codon:yes gene_type:complete
MFSFTLLFGQIKITDVGDGWKGKVEQALDTIKKYDTEKYNLVIGSCMLVGYWNESFSTTEGDTTILISTKDMDFNNIYNIASILVHESTHLYIKQLYIKVPPNKEEVLAYQYELDFLKKIPNVDQWLIDNSIKKIIHYSSKN